MPKAVLKKEVVVLIVVGVIVSMFYVWQRIQIYRFGYKVREQTKIFRALQEEKNSLIAQYSMQTSPVAIIRKIKKFNLSLKQPAKEHIRIISYDS